MGNRSTSRGEVLAVVLLCAGAATPVIAQIAPTGVVAAAAEIGLTPESVTLVGLHESASTLLERLESAETLRAMLSVAHAERDQAAGALAQLAADIQSSAADDAAVAQYTLTEATLESSLTQIAAIQDELRAVVLEGVPAGQVQQLSLWRGAASRRVDPAFRLLEHADDEWTQIEAAVRAEKRAIQLGEPLGDPWAGLLNELRAHPVVTEGQLRIELYLPGTENVFSVFSQS